MKKQLKILTSSIVFLVIILVGFFAWQVLSGVKPVIIEAPANIADLIEKASEEESENTEGEDNFTTLPLNLPDNFSISIFARDLGKVRTIINSPGGSLLASRMGAGEVVAIVDKNLNGKADDIVTVLDGLFNPHGLVLKCSGDDCKLYVAETNAVSVFKYDKDNYTASNKEKLFDLPAEGGHFTRTLMLATINGEEKLLTSVGSSCNVCEEEDPFRATILISDLDGSNLHVFAKGLRNSVFMATQPVTGEIWATDNGRDWLGDNLPPEEINIIRDGGDYGWPICYGNNIHDTNFDNNQYIRNPCEDKTPAHIEMQAHSAPLGIDFIPEEGWPEEYWYNAIVAYHGSWNRSQPTGYKLVRVKLDETGIYEGEVDFISGWLTNDNEALGRPVAVLIQPGGIMYISDDKAGVIYRVTYTSETASNSDAGVKSEEIKLDQSFADKLLRSPIKITGQARGYWYFEGDFPVKLLDDNGKEVAVSIAEAQGEWMTEDFVPFEVNLTFSPPTTEIGQLVLTKDNPSGLVEHDDALQLPVRFAEISLGESCRSDSDCKLPGEYAIRSMCPYEARCINSTCTVICPDF